MNKKNIKLIIITGIMIFNLFSFPSLCTAKQQPNTEEPLDKVVAIVNDDVITQQELNSKLRIVKKQLSNSSAQYPDEAQLRTKVLDALIDQKVELQTAARAGIEVNDESVSKGIQEIAARNNMNLNEFNEYLTTNGFNLPEFREEIRNQMIVDQLLQREIASRIKVSKEEVDKYLNSIAFEQQNISEYRLQDILIALPEIPSTTEVNNADNKVADIMQKIKEGKKFEEIAITQSDGQAALKAGDLNWRRIEELPTVFAERVQVMEVGEVVGPIRAPNGYHIIKLVDKRGTAGRHTTTETKVRHILLRSDPITTEDDLKKKAESIREEIEKGLSFAQAAKKYSQDPISAAKGGDLGWVSQEHLVPPFTKAMNELAIGIVSMPVRTQFGWHLIEVQERRQIEDTEEFQRQQIRKLVFERKYNEETEAWIRKMRTASFIEIKSN